MLNGPPISPDQASSLGSSAQGSAGPSNVGSATLPCQAWKLHVTVRSTVPYHPEGTVNVSANITTGGVGYSTERTRMDGELSPVVQLSGSSRYTYSVSASADKWESAGAGSISVSPRIEPFTLEIRIKPKKPWVILKVVNDADGKLIPRFSLGLKLGENKKSATTSADKPTIVEELEHAESDGPFLTIARARNFDLSACEHPDEVWEHVSIAES